MEIANGSLFPSPVCPSLSHRRPTVPRRLPPLWAGRRPTPVLPPLHASSLDPWTHYPLALELLPFATPPPKLRAAATATPPWRARCTTPARQLARAPASGEPLHSIPLVPTLFSRLHIPEHPHRPLNAGESRLTAEPRFHSCLSRKFEHQFLARSGAKNKSC